MGSFINNPSSLASLWQLFVIPANNENLSPSANGPWRPPQWNQGNQLTSFTVTDSQGNQSVYFFDAVLRADHNQEVRITQQPVQNGAPVADHSYKLPARVELSIGMSDAMDRYDHNAYYSNGPKSVSAFNTFLDVADKRSLIVLTTRLKTYENMVLTRVQAIDDYRTKFGLRAILIFEQVFPAQVSASLASQASERAQQSQSTSQGTTLPQAVPDTVTNSFKTDQTTTVPFAGDWSSSPF